MIDLAELDKVFRDSMYREEELPEQLESADDRKDPRLPTGAVVVDGVIHKFAFHPGRLEFHRDEVHAWLAQLPHGFRANKGGGWSFLNACNLESGEQWTGLHLDMEKLFSLGIGLRLVKEQMPGMRDVLPGGMPYYAIYLDGVPAYG